MIQFCIKKEQIEKALADLKKLEERGFDNSLAVFELTEVGDMLHQDIAEYDDKLIMIAENKNYGSIRSDWIEWYKFENGECVEL